MAARALTSEQVTALVGVARRLLLENRVLPDILDGSGGAGWRVDKLCEFSGAVDDFADWSLRVKYPYLLWNTGPRAHWREQRDV